MTWRANGMNRAGRVSSGDRCRAPPLAAKIPARISAVARGMAMMMR
jgi:hypothetical protein